jgi:hypothetical protein
MEHGFKSFAVIDNYVVRVAAPPSGVVACLAEAYPKRRYLALPDWAAALLFRIG